MGNNLIDNALLSTSTLNLHSGLCYSFVVNKDYTAYRTSSDVLTGTCTTKRTETVQLDEDEKKMIDEFVNYDVLANDYKTNFDFDVLFKMSVRSNGLKKEVINNDELEARTYQIIEEIANRHNELSETNLHSLEDIKNRSYLDTRSTFMDYGHLQSVEPVYKKSK